MSVWPSLIVYRKMPKMSVKCKICEVYFTTKDVRRRTCGHRICQRELQKRNFNKVDKKRRFKRLVNNVIFHEYNVLLPNEEIKTFIYKGQQL